MKQIRLSKSCLSENEKEAVLDVLDREYLGMGKDVQEFERLLEEYFARPVACVNTGTAALHLALQAIGLNQGDEVLVQSLTFVACFQMITAVGATPIACEVDPNTITIDLNDAAKKLTSRTKAIMPIHYSGGVGDLDAIYKFAQEHKLRVIEDASHGFGSTYKNRLVGSFGDIAVFSFDGIKNITSGEGGCVISNDAKVMSHVRDARLLAVEKDTEKRFAGARSWDFDVKHQGFRYHMSNIMAAIGIEQFKRYEEFKTKRQNYAKLYQKNLGNNQSVGVLDLNYDQVVPHIFVIKLLKHSRKEIQSHLEKFGIQTGIHYQPNHLLTYFKNIKEVSLPISEAIAPRLLTLPLHADLNIDDIEFVCKKLLEVLK